ncbi:hypothetical protein HKBW3S44_01351 [Candidatus Hakubella thermalkaliphila]|uniref:CN hydrolase domain-containing protein n=1 Tax=Candidatus Hakubella thermalkaliphila TaxID=2754717 RepID=A0A6V8Q0N2_9ACTN|nr:nitrilase-related carbon-nitrogen hydrolase [Candidatus Hakubella thermalkaliphila]GFP37674.1 hypothetical protein HKBW3S44_01351 [Candidatus Hakubella thermalkaliphila]
MKVRERLLLRSLDWRTRRALLDRHLRGQKISPSGNCQTIDRRRVRVGAAQLEVRLFSDPREYIDEMCRFTALAAAQGVQLLVFPEYNSLQLLRLIAGITALTEEMVKGEGVSPVKPADLFRFAGPVFGRVAELTFSFLARAHGIYIMAGSFPLPAGRQVLNRALLYGPDGRLIGCQDKAHLTPLEDDWGLSRGGSFAVFPTPLGRLAMPVCMDATYFETFRILESLGAEIVMVPIANPEPYNFWLALRGVWPRVQESQVFGVKSALVGSLFGRTLTGKAGVFAPLELTQRRDGVLAETESAEREGFVAATLDLEALRELKANHPYLRDENPALARKYFPAVYGQASR